MKTAEQIIEIIQPYQVLAACSNYIQFIDTNNRFREVQYSPLLNGRPNDRWYEIKTTGRSDSPTERFVGYID